MNNVRQFLGNQNGRNSPPRAPELQAAYERLALYLLTVNSPFHGGGLDMLAGNMVQVADLPTFLASLERFRMMLVGVELIDETARQFFKVSCKSLIALRDLRDQIESNIFVGAPMLKLYLGLKKMLISMVKKWVSYTQEEKSAGDIALLASLKQLRKWQNNDLRHKISLMIEERYSASLEKIGDERIEGIQDRWGRIPEYDLMRLSRLCANLLAAVEVKPLGAFVTRVLLYAKFSGLNAFPGYKNLKHLWTCLHDEVSVLIESGRKSGVSTDREIRLLKDLGILKFTLDITGSSEPKNKLPALVINEPCKYKKESPSSVVDVSVLDWSSFRPI